MPARSQKASVLIVVLVTIVFVSAALVAFVQRATDDLLVPTRQTDASRLRGEAYSAMETSLAVLTDFRIANGGLHSPNEGWGDPLSWVSYTPLVEGRQVSVTFEDESGKMSLPVVSSAITTNNLTNNPLYYFLTTTASQSSDDASLIQDSLLTWMKKNFSPTTSGATTAAQYEQDTIPFAPPSRSLRSWYELQSIDGVSSLFFDANGRITEVGRRFISAFSLYNFASSNVNAGNVDAIETLGQLSDSGAQSILNVVSTTDSNTSGAANTNQTSAYFSKIADAAQAAGVATLNPSSGGGRGGGGGGPTLGVTISALRVNVTVKEGQSLYNLSALVSFPAGTATTGTALATPVAAPTITASATNAGITTTAASAATATTVTTSSLGAVVALNYPYTILELSESDLDPAAQTAQTTSTAMTTTGINNAADSASYSNVNLPPPTT
jgi:general secretion pathway protein K